ncbi:hypothetical protein VTN77DRAFT_4698 [Rasamsonia byssochlamydoides]|uniref:uncharacterized protein n=1 Tax=Rasamsonia byssochlamydoides TaxID=89139 RepID=UPI0037443D2F
MKRLTEDWADKFRTLVHNISDAAEVTAVTMQDWFPTAQREQGHGRIVLMGDAAHTMTMFRGEGANNAVVDVHDFVKRVGHLLQPADETVSWEAIEQGLQAYDKDVFARGQPCVVNARQACLDAHDYSRITDESPLISKRVVKQEG